MYMYLCFMYMNSSIVCMYMYKGLCFSAFMYMYSSIVCMYMYKGLCFSSFMYMYSSIVCMHVHVQWPMLQYLHVFQYCMHVHVQRSMLQFLHVHVFQYCMHACTCTMVYASVPSCIPVLYACMYMYMYKGLYFSALSIILGHVLVLKCMIFLNIPGPCSSPPPTAPFPPASQSPCDPVPTPFSCFSPDSKPSYHSTFQIE